MPAWSPVSLPWEAGRRALGAKSWTRLLCWLLVSKALAEDRSSSSTSLSLQLEADVALTISSNCFGKRDSVPSLFLEL